MNPVDILIIAIVVLILAGAAFCIRRAKKKGVRCIGCPDSCACSQGNCAGGCSGCQEK